MILVTAITEIFKFVTVSYLSSSHEIDFLALTQASVNQLPGSWCKQSEVLNLYKAPRMKKAKQ